MLAHRLTHRLLDRITRNAPCQIIHSPLAKSCILLQSNHCCFQRVENKGPVIPSGYAKSWARSGRTSGSPCSPPPVSNRYVTAIMIPSAEPALPSAQLEQRGNTGGKMNCIEWKGLSNQNQPTAGQKSLLPLEFGFWSSGSVLQR